MWIPFDFASNSNIVRIIFKSNLIVVQLFDDSWLHLNCRFHKNVMQIIGDGWRSFLFIPCNRDECEYSSNIWNWIETNVECISHLSIKKTISTIWIVAQSNLGIYSYIPTFIGCNNVHRMYYPVRYNLFPLILNFLCNFQLAQQFSVQSNMHLKKESKTLKSLTHPEKIHQLQ